MIQNRDAIGWPLLPLPDAEGQMHYPALDESVRQSIQVILSTRPREQLMRPGFGAGLQQFLHQPNTLTTRRRIQEVVTGALTQWEPRIILDRVDVLDMPEQPGSIRIEVAYRLSRSGAPAQLGVTLALEA